MDLRDYFDQYNLKARVFPALIAGIPTFALLAIIVPWIHLDITNAIAVLVALVLTHALADVARSRGKIIQNKLGTGATPEQWLASNNEIPANSKIRFKAFLSSQLGVSPPTIDEEITNPSKTEDFYLSANAWLRDKTRDTVRFNILFNENITYGFRRNLLGLKYLALAFNALVILICIAIIKYNPPYFAKLANIEEKIIITLAAALLHSLYIIFAVNKNSVRQASKAYGRQLILSCDSLIPPETSKS